VLHVLVEEFESAIRSLDTWEAVVAALVVVFFVVAFCCAFRPSSQPVVRWAAPPALAALAFAVLLASNERRLKELVSQEVNDVSGWGIAFIQLLASRGLVVFLACCTVVCVLVAGGAGTVWQVSHSKSRTLATGVAVMAIFAPMLAGIAFALFQGITGDDRTTCFIPQELRMVTEYALSSLRVGCGATALLLVLAGASGVVVLSRARGAAPMQGPGALESRLLYGLASAMALAAATVDIASVSYATERTPPDALPSFPPCDCESPRGADGYLGLGVPLDWERRSELARQLRRTGSPSVFVSGATPLTVVSAALATIRDHGVANVCLQGIDDRGFNSRVLGRIRAPLVWHVLASSVADPSRPGRRIAIGARKVADEVPAIVEQLRRSDPTMLLFDSLE
jgi:hypothetical protein